MLHVACVVCGVRQLINSRLHTPTIIYDTWCDMREMCNVMYVVQYAHATLQCRVCGAIQCVLCMWCNTTWCNMHMRRAMS